MSLINIQRKNIKKEILPNELKKKRKRCYSTSGNSNPIARPAIPNARKFEYIVNGGPFAGGYNESNAKSIIPRNPDRTCIRYGYVNVN